MTLTLSDRTRRQYNCRKKQRNITMRDWRQLYQKYRGQWVALGADRMTVIAHGSSRREVKEQAAKLGNPHPLVLRFPEELTAFAG
jgi:hypothetical protein